MKKLTALVLALCVLLTMSVSALAFEDPQPQTLPFPITEDPITLNVFTTDLLYKQCDFQDVEIWKYMAEKTGISLNFEVYDSESVAEKFSLMMTRKDEDLPDVILRCDQTQAQVQQLVDEGIIVPITDLLPEYAPNFWYQIQHNPSLKAYLTMNDGEIYGMNELHYAKNYLTQPMFVQNEWLKALGYDEVPADTEELKQMLIKFRDSDLNGNGEKDEVGFIATGFEGLMRCFAGAFGVNTRGRTSLYLDADDNGALRFIPTCDNYRKLMSYLHDLYAEGLIYEEIFDSSIKKMTAVGEQNRVLMAVGSQTYLGETNKNNYGGMTTIFKGPDGYQMNANITNPIGEQNTFFTVRNEHVKEALQYFDYFYSREGVTLYFMGFEGVTYELDENGDPWFNDYVNNNPDGLNNEEAMSKYVAWGNAGNPTFYEDKTFGNNFYTAMESEVCAKRLEASIDEVWGNFNYTADEYTTLSMLETDILNYVKDSRAAFVKGEKDINDDAVWNEYLNTLNTMKLEELMKVYQNGLERYQAAAAQ